MGLIRSGLGLLFGGEGRGVQALGQAVTGVAGAFHPNATRRLELGHDAYKAAHASHAAEFAHARAGRFDRLVNGLNRLPRPTLAMGTLGLFSYAMIDPLGFTRRMQALHAVPEPLWWLLGAVVAFYFGAREAHHLRTYKPIMSPAPIAARSGDGAVAAPQRPEDTPRRNPALDDWRRNAPDQPPMQTP